MSQAHPSTPDPRSHPATASVRRLLTLTEAAELLGLSVASIRRLVGAGKVPAVRLTRRIHLDIRDLDRLVEQAKHRTTW